MASDFLKLPKPNADEFRTEEEFQGHLYREAVALAMVVKSLPSSADGIHAKIENANDGHPRDDRSIKSVTVASGADICR